MWQCSLYTLCVCVCVCIYNIISILNEKMYLGSEGVKDSEICNALLTVYCCNVSCIAL